MLIEHFNISYSYARFLEQTTLTSPGRTRKTSFAFSFNGPFRVAIVRRAQNSTEVASDTTRVVTDGRIVYKRSVPVCVIY